MSLYKKSSVSNVSCSKRGGEAYSRDSAIPKLFDTDSLPAIQSIQCIRDTVALPHSGIIFDFGVSKD